MRILFVMRHGGYVRNFEWVLRALAERGHQVQLGFERGRAKGMEERIERGAAASTSRTRSARTPAARSTRSRPDPRGPLARARLRAAPVGQLPALSLTGLPRRDQAPRALGAGDAAGGRHARAGLLAARAARARAAVGGAPRAAVCRGRRPPSRRRLRRGADHPARRRPLAARLAPQRPGARDPGRARGRELGQPHEQGRDVHRPDRTYVWNEIQRREAVELHGLDPPGRGARRPHFDHWFNWQPSIERDAFS